MFSLHGKNAIVTGAAKGIGKGIAELFCQAGANVLIADRDAAQAKETCREFSSKHAHCHWIAGDVSKRADARKMVGECVRKFGSVDILVNNAGIYPFVPFLKMKEKEWQKVLDVNLNGTFHCTQEATARMVKAGKGGKIVNIASVAGILGFAGLSHYCTTKSGIMGFTRTVALELAQYKINVNAIGPGAIVTPGSGTAKMDPKARKAMEDGIPWKRVGVPRDIAAAAVFLSSQEADYMTGQTIFVDGGMSIP